MARKLSDLTTGDVADLGFTALGLYGLFTVAWALISLPFQLLAIALLDWRDDLPSEDEQMRIFQEIRRREGLIK